MVPCRRTQRGHLTHHLSSPPQVILNHQIFNRNSTLSFDAGILNLEQKLKDNNQKCEMLWDRNSLWPDFGSAEVEWKQECRDALLHSIASLKQFVEVETVVLTSYIPENIRTEICRDLEAAAPGIKAMSGAISVAPKAVSPPAAVKAGCEFPVLGCE